MKYIKPMTLIGISLLALSSVLCFNTLVMPVSATTIYTGDYVWLGGYLNVTLTLVNLTDGSIFAHTTSNQSLDYWEDQENFTFTDASPYNVLTPKDGYVPSYSPTYSADLTADLGFDTWYQIRLQWRLGEGDGYGKHGDIDTDYHTFVNATGKYAVTPGGVVEVDSTGDWIGDGTTDGAGSMWAFQPLFINATMYLGGCPPSHLIDLPLVNVNMDSWITTGSVYCNVTYPDHPLDGLEVSGHGISQDSDYNSTVLIGANAEINRPATFKNPLSGNETPLNVSYIYVHKHLTARTDVLLQGDATMDGNVNVWDLGRMSDWWLTDSTSKPHGTMIGILEEIGDWDEVYRVTKEVNSLDFNGDELINVWDLGILSDNWLTSGWSPPVSM